MLAVMGTIFTFSNQRGEASSAASNSTGSFILELLHIEVPAGQSPDSVPIIFGFTIRNLAHIFLFGCLGLTSYLFCLSVVSLLEVLGYKLRGYWAFDAAMFALGISFLYACLDEIHQYFVGGRSATVRDIGIDAIGFLMAIGLSFGLTALIEYFCRRGRRKKRVEA